MSRFMGVRLMAVFSDTDIFVVLWNADDELRARSKELMKPALKSEFGRVYTSDYGIDEAITTALVRTRRHNLAVDVGKHITESPRITKLLVEKDSFEKSMEKIQTFMDKPLSFTDCTSLALMEKSRITQIASFDSGFDGLAQRIY